MTTVHPSLAGGGEGGPVPWHPHGGDDLSGQATFLQLHVENLLAGTIDSKEIVISGGTDGVIRSDNFETGVSGWAIFGDGSIEARSITIVADAGSEVDWSFIQNVSVATADIENAAITTAKIDDAAITNAKINDLSADKITAGTITSLRYRTATSGNARLEIRGESQEKFIRFIDAGDLTRGTMGQSTAPSGGDGLKLSIGSIVLELDDVGGVFANTPFLGPSGLTSRDGVSVPAYSFSADKDTGMYQVSGGVIGFSLNGTNAMRIGGQIQFLDGSSASPAYSFLNDTDLGIYRQTGNTMGFSTGGSDSMRVGANVQIVTPNSTGSAANLAVGGATLNSIIRATSARKYKKRVTYNVDYLADIDLAPTKHWRPDDKKWRYALIADDLADQDPLLGEYDEAGDIEHYDIPAILAVYAAKLNRLEALVLEAA